MSKFSSHETVEQPINKVDLMHPFPIFDSNFEKSGILTIKMAALFELVDSFILRLPTVIRLWVERRATPIPSFAGLGRRLFEIFLVLGVFPPAVLLLDRWPPRVGFDRIHGIKAKIELRIKVTEVG